LSWDTICRYENQNPPGVLSVYRLPAVWEGRGGEGRGGVSALHYRYVRYYMYSNIERMHIIMYKYSTRAGMPDAAVVPVRVLVLRLGSYAWCVCVYIQYSSR